jgi:hypothetical protein
MCEAIKKDGSKCSYKSKCGSKFCGVHKNFIDTSKSLFTEDIEEEEKLTLNFMTGENIKINKGYTLDYILNIIKQNNPLDNYHYSIFKEGGEDKITDYTYKFNDENYFCMPSQKFTYEVGTSIYIYNDPQNDHKVIHSKKSPIILLEENPHYRYWCYYQIRKQTKCFVEIYHSLEYGKDTGNYRYKFYTDEDGNEYCKNGYIFIIPSAKIMNGG